MRITSESDWSAPLGAKLSDYSMSLYKKLLLPGNHSGVDCAEESEHKTSCCRILRTMATLSTPTLSGVITATVLSSAPSGSAATLATAAAAGGAGAIPPLPVSCLACLCF